MKANSWPSQGVLAEARKEPGVVTVAPFDARSRRIARILRLLVLVSLGTLLVLVYWAAVAFLTLRRGSHVRLTAEDGSGDVRLRDILARAYPDGIVEKEYRPLLGFLARRVPSDAIARTVSGPARVEVAQVLADLADLDSVSTEEAEAVGQKLTAQGFDDWVRRYA